jgi:antitoxin YefM
MPVETTYTQLRAELSSVLDRVVALIPADELASLMETAHLLRSPKNAERLLRALRRADRREGKPESVESLRRSLKFEP